jgi:hypothetical protein
MTTPGADPRFTPIPQQTWPQMDNRVPRAMSSQMPHIETTNFERARQEAFTMSGTFTLPTTITVGQQLALILPTDQDGDFWCDQIYMVGWGLQLNPAASNVASSPLMGTIDIVDIRTSKALTFPLGSLPTNFLASVTNFSDDPGYDPGANPYPAGFRSTSTLAQPFCFTRAGGISLNLVSAAQWAGVPGPNLVDIAFGGWKEYQYASA